MTTGKTVINLITAIVNNYPGIRRFTIFTLLDWRSLEDQKRFATTKNQLGIELEVVSLMGGEIEVAGEFVQTTSNINQPEVKSVKAEVVILPAIFKNYINIQSVDSAGQINNAPYLKGTGRFGMNCDDQSIFKDEAKKLGRRLCKLRQGGKALFLGTGEFMYLPIKAAAYAGTDIKVQATTQSPAHAFDIENYAIKYVSKFPCPADPTIENFVYNVRPGEYDEVYLFLEREVPKEHLTPIIEAFESAGIKRIFFVVCSLEPVAEPKVLGSYDLQDVTFLLKDIGSEMAETALEDREETIQGGRPYYEMLPIEYKPSKECLELFHKMLYNTAPMVAKAVGIVAEVILKKRGPKIVLASLARAGTPAGILIKRYLAEVCNINTSHYTMSILRGRGFDENAVRYIIAKHPCADIQFVDGWTGKGAITKVLAEACGDFAQKYGVELSSEIAVLADPGHCTTIFGTREDFLIPSACLNATVSGLISRTLYHPDIISSREFHGVKFYKEWLQEDVSNLFIDTVAAYFAVIAKDAKHQAELVMQEPLPAFQGLSSIKDIIEHYNIEDINLVKPGIGETTRVLLRRVPWKIIVSSLNNPELDYMLMLAKERKVPVEVWKGLTYSCCGLIKPQGMSN